MPSLPVYNTTNHCNTSFIVQEFGQFIHIDLTSVYSKVVQIGDSIIKKGKDVDFGKPIYKHTNSTSRSELFVSAKYYEKKVSENPEDPSWVFWIEPEDHFVGITRPYLEAYKEFDTKKLFYGAFSEMVEKYQPILPLLQSGNFQLVVNDRLAMCHLLYGVDGKPIPRRIPVDSLKQQEYRFKGLIPHLKKHSQVQDLEVFNIPSYNSSYEGEKGVTFFFVSKTQEEFEKVLADKDVCWTKPDGLKQILGTEQFLKPKADEDDWV